MFSPDPNDLAALEMFAGDPASDLPPAPEPVECGACGTIIDPVTGDVIDGGAAPPMAPAMSPGGGPMGAPPMM